MEKYYASGYTYGYAPLIKRYMAMNEKQNIAYKMGLCILYKMCIGSF